MDNETVKHMSRNLMFTIPEIAVQKLPEGVEERKNSKEIIIFFLQEFNNDTYTLGPRFEFETTDKESLTSFRDRISKTTKINLIGLVSGDSWIGHSRLQIPHLKWNCPPECDDNGTPVHMDTSRVKSLNIQDGDLVLFKDMTVVPMPLNEQEQKAIKEVDAKLRANLLNSSGRSAKRFGNARESKLVIQQKDVVLDDDDGEVTKK